MKIAILGMGNVGTGVYNMLKEREDLQITRIFGRHILPEAASLRTENIEDIFADPEIDTVVELLGGSQPAHSYALAALKAGKNLVSANKMMISADMQALMNAAHESGVHFRMSASVGGGIPYLHNLMRARRIDPVQEIGGIINGTTNLILDAMQRNGLDFDVALKQAQEAGYAEADPSADIDGLDAECKLSISASTAFNAYISTSQIDTAGIRNMRSTDVANFKGINRVCRLIARAAKTENGVCAYIEPTLVHPEDPEASVYRNDNYIRFDCPHAGKQAFVGQGAGKFPTAYAVVSDLEDILLNYRLPQYVYSGNRITVNNRLEKHRYYVRTRAHIPFEAECGENNAFITAPTSVTEMHALMQAAAKEDSDTFYAGIRD